MSKTTQLSMQWTDWLLLVLLSLLWGSSFAFNELLLRELPPITIVWCRQLLASIFFLLAAARFIPQTTFTFSLVWRVMVMALVSIAIPFSLFSFGQQYINSALAGIGNGSVPFFTLIWAAILLKDENITRMMIIGLMIGFSGLMMLFWPMLSVGDFASAAGMLIVTLAAAMYGFANTFVRSIPKVSLIVQGLLVNFFALTFLTPLMLWEDPDWSRLSMQGMVYIGAHGILGSFVAYSLYLYLVRRIGSVNISQVAYLIPFSSLFLGLVWLREQITLWAFLGLGLVLLGMWIKDRSQKNALKQ